MAPRHTVYQAFGTPRHTWSHISPSGPSDQLADPANHSRRISSTEIQRFTAFSYTGAPCARLHHSTSQSLSLLSPVNLSLFSDLPSPVVWSLRTTTERSPTSYKAKPRSFSAFLPPHLAGKRARFSSATEASSRQFSLISHQQNPRHQIYQDRPSVGQKSRRKISPPPTVTACVPHAPPVAFFRNFSRKPRVFQSFTYTVALS